MVAPVQEQRIADLVVVQTVKARNAVIAEVLRRHALHGEKSQRLPRQPRQTGRHRNRVIVVRFMNGARKRRPRRIQQRGRKSVLIVERQVLVARSLFRVGDRNFDGWRAVYRTVVKREAAKQIILRRKLMIDPSLQEIFVGGLRTAE